MEQFNLDFGPQPKKPEESAEPDPASLTDDDLAILYKKEIGLDPTVRAFDRETILQGLAAGRDVEIARIGELDKEADTEDLVQTYRR
jgi:hypothetical protein